MKRRECSCYLVWTGCAWWRTWAVSQAKAVSNVAYRMRKAGKFPVLSQFEAKLDDGKAEAQ